MTSAQLREKKIDDQHEGSINKLEKDLLKNMVKKESEVFIGSVEEDTEELSLSF
jgi:acetylglutamate kinase